MVTDPLPHEVYTILPYRFPWLTLGLLIVAVLVLIGVSVYFWRRRWRPRVAVAEFVDPVQVVKEKIMRLSPPEPFVRGRVQQDYFFELGIAFRELIEQRFRVRAVGATLQEIKPRLQILPLSASTITSIVEFMARADEIKFADRPSDLAQARRDHRQVRMWTNRLVSGIGDVRDS